MEKQSSIFDGTTPSSRFLTDIEIDSAVKLKGMITYFDESCLAPNSYDMRVGRKAILGGSKKIINLEQEGSFNIQPGNYALIISYESLKLPRSVFVRIGPKRRFAYEGLILLSGSLVDPGYEGHLLLGYYNASPRDINIRYESKVCNLSFMYFEGSTQLVVSPDPRLIKGDIPDEYINQMINVEVHSWKDLSERIKEVENLSIKITKLETDFKGVIEPIGRLRESVEILTKDVTSLSEIAKGNVNSIQDLSRLIGILDERGKEQSSVLKDQGKSLEDLSINVKAYSLISYIGWGIFLVIVSVLLTLILTKSI